MTLSALLMLPLIAAFFFGWLFFAWEHWKWGGTSDTFWSLSKVAGVVAILLLFAATTQADHISPLLAWEVGGSAGRRLMWVVWAIFGLPLWGLGLLLFPAAARDVLMRFPSSHYLSPGVFVFLGWLMIGWAWLVFWIWAALG